MTEVIVFKSPEWFVNTTAYFYANTSNGYSATIGNANGSVKMTLRIVNANSNPVVLQLTNATFSGNITVLGNSAIFLVKNANDSINCSASFANSVTTAVFGFTY